MIQRLGGGRSSSGSMAKKTGPKPGMEWSEATSCATCGWVGPLLASAYHAQQMVCVPCKRDEEFRSDYLVFARLRGKEYKRPISGFGNQAYRDQRADRSWLTVKSCATCGKPPPLMASTVRARKAVCLSCAEKEEKLSNFKIAQRLRLLEYGVDFPRFHEGEAPTQKQQQALVARRQSSMVQEVSRPPSAAIRRALSVLSPTAYAPGDLVRYTKAFLRNPGWISANPDPATVLQVHPAKEGRSAVLMLAWGDARMVPVSTKDVERVSGATPTSRAWAARRLAEELKRDQKPTKGSRSEVESLPAACARRVGEDLELLEFLRHNYWNDRGFKEKEFGWTAGGCWAFAKAFRKVFGGKYISICSPEWPDEEDQWITHHVGVVLPEHPGLVFDALGATEEGAWFKKFLEPRYFEHEEPEETLEFGAPRDERKLFAGRPVVQAVEDALRKTKGAHGSQAMITPAGLPAGFRVVVGTNVVPWEGRTILNTSIVLIEAPSDGLKNGFEVGEIGLDTIHDRSNRLWRVGLVEAERGFGPLLYDLAMEYVFLTGGEGLMASREEVSPAASSVWKAYQASRPDVMSRPAEGHKVWTKGENNLLDRPWLDRIYAKNSAPFFTQLKARGMLDFERSPQLRRAWPYV